MEGLKYAGQRVLVLAPHADDEVIGCGGILQKFMDEGCEVKIVIASFVLSNYSKYHKEHARYEMYSGEDRMKELKKAYEILGVDDYHILYLEGNPQGGKASVNPAVRYHSRLDTIPKLELVEQIEKQIEDFQPTIILMPSVTKHQDHVVLHEVALTAARPYFWDGSLLVYETDGELDFRPNLFVPMTAAQLQKKLDSLCAFQTQVGLPPHPVSPQVLRAKASFRGQQIYVEYAEAFQVQRLRG